MGTVSLNPVKHNQCVLSNVYFSLLSHSAIKDLPFESREPGTSHPTHDLFIYFHSGNPLNNNMATRFCRRTTIKLIFCSHLETFLLNMNMRILQ